MKRAAVENFPGSALRTFGCRATQRQHAPLDRALVPWCSSHISRSLYYHFWKHILCSDFDGKFQTCFTLSDRQCFLTNLSPSSNKKKSVFLVIVCRGKQEFLINKSSSNKMFNISPLNTCRNNNKLYVTMRFYDNFIFSIIISLLHILKDCHSNILHRKATTWQRVKLLRHT